MAETADSDYSAEEWLNQKLPAAVQKVIYDYLEVSDKLTLRAAFSKTQRVFVDNALQGTVNTLYVSPSKNSLANFEFICSSEYFQQRITHIVFVPKAIGDEDFAPRHSFKQYRKHVPALSLEDARHSFCIYRDLITDNEIAVSPAVYGGGSDKAVVKLLREGMRRLPKLAAVSVVEAIAHDGLNVSPLWYSKGFAESKIVLGHHVVGQDPASRAAVEVLGRISADHGIDTFFEALSKARLRLESLTLGQGMTHQLWSEIQVCTDFGADTLKAVFSRVKKLSIACMDVEQDDVDDDDDFHGMWKHIAQCAVNLEELHLYNGMALCSAFWRTPGDGVPVLDHFLHFGRFPKLKTLQVQGDHTKPGMLNAKHFKHFLGKHRDISFVNIQDMLLSDESEDVCGAMKSVFEYARSKMSKDSNFSMKVHARDEHDDGLCTVGGRYECDGTCDMYLIKRRTWMDRSELDDLAKELEVNIVDGSWDFGAYVMRG